MPKLSSKAAALRYHVPYFTNASSAWQARLRAILGDSTAAPAPRQQGTLEQLHASFCLDMTRPNVAVVGRKVSYRFMADEALWILRGSNRLEDLGPMREKWAQYSDDGETLFGAYGPPFVDQVKYVVDALFNDRDTRQAVMTFWRPNPPASKDVPCTVALTFNIRPDWRALQAAQVHGERLSDDDCLVLNCHAFMRSSDAYKGLPYDMFTFSVLAAAVLSEFNQRVVASQRTVLAPVGLGLLYWTAVSSHLYLSDFQEAQRFIYAENLHVGPVAPQPMPTDSLLYGNFAPLLDSLIACQTGNDNRDLYWRIRPTGVNP